MRTTTIGSKSNWVRRIPRTIPEIRWITPIYHPNISEIGMVCLGGYGTHWVPSVQLDELCNMLWDMARYQNYDIRSPYNRDAALWVASQTKFLFPMDPRPLRDVRIAMGRVESAAHPEACSTDAAHGDHPNGSSKPAQAITGAGREPAPARVREFMNQYRGIFARSRTPAAAQEVHRQHEVADEMDRAFRAAGAPHEANMLVPGAGDDEIVLLESAAPNDTRNDATRESVDGIMFIE